MSRLFNGWWLAEAFLAVYDGMGRKVDGGLWPVIGQQPGGLKAVGMCVDMDSSGCNKRRNEEEVNWRLNKSFYKIRLHLSSVAVVVVLVFAANVSLGHAI